MPTATFAGGVGALTDDPTPQISGTADVAPGTTVTVTLADETLTGPVQAGGVWSVTASALSDGPHRVVMSVSDAAGNLATLTQTLRVDTGVARRRDHGRGECDHERPRRASARDMVRPRAPAGNKPGAQGNAAAP